MFNDLGQKVYGGFRIITGEGTALENRGMFFVLKKAPGLLIELTLNVLNKMDFKSYSCLIAS